MSTCFGIEELKVTDRFVKTGGGVGGKRVKREKVGWSGVPDRNEVVFARWLWCGGGVEEGVGGDGGGEEVRFFKKGNFYVGYFYVGYVD